LMLPYERRVPAMGWFVRSILAPIVGYNRRSLANLAYIYPDMPMAERRRIMKAVADNIGRTFIENYSTDVQITRHKTRKFTGDGVDDLFRAKAEGRPVILVTGHYGNYEVPRAALISQGFDVGGLYRPASNAYFEEHYSKTMTVYGSPVFAQGNRGTAGFVRHLKSGGMAVLLFDRHVSEGTVLPFMGKPAKTALSAAQMALKYDALLIPFWGIRRANGIDFDIVFDAPVPHTDAETMTLKLNEILERRIHDDPGQWLWVHRRWKVNKTK